MPLPSAFWSIPLRLAALALFLAFAGFLGQARAQGGPASNVVPGEEHCVVNVRADDVLNLRAGPGVGHAIVAGLRYGACGVMVSDDCRGNWCPVEDGHHAGWVNARFIAMVSPAMYCVDGVGAAGLPLRAWPDHGSRILATLGPAACGIAFLPYARDGWQKIRVDGFEGWVPRANLSGQ